MQHKAQIQHHLKLSEKQSQSNSARDSTAMFYFCQKEDCRNFIFQYNLQGKLENANQRRSLERINLVPRVSRKETATSLISQPATYQDT